MFGVMNSVSSEKQLQQYAANAETYRKQADEISKEAGGLEKESHLRGAQGLRFHIGEVFLEIAIVFASLAILAKRPMLYWIAVTSGLLGITIALTELFVHG